MKTIVALLAAACAFLTLSTAADARGGPGAAGGPGMGASGFSPGAEFRSNGPTGGYPGASGYAPGKLMRAKGRVSGYHGASYYAPGHKLRPKHH